MYTRVVYVDWHTVCQSPYNMLMGVLYLDRLVHIRSFAEPNKHPVTTSLSSTWRSRRIKGKGRQCQVRNTSVWCGSRRCRLVVKVTGMPASSVGSRDIGQISVPVRVVSCLNFVLIDWYFVRWNIPSSDDKNILLTFRGWPLWSVIWTCFKIALLKVNLAVTYRNQTNTRSKVYKCSSHGFQL